jgi:hypothetical protein
VFAVGLANKTPTSIIRGLESIASSQSGGALPVILQTDNGTEFMGEMKAWCTAHDIQQVFTRTHTPQSNGLVENFNLYLRKMIREGFVRTNSLKWAPHLTDYLFNRNHTKHTRTRFTPADVWTPTRVPMGPGRNIPAHGDDVLSQQEIQTKVRERTNAQAKATLARYKDEKFEVGDRARIKLSAVDTRVQKEIKAGNHKLLPVKFSPLVYTVNRIYNPKPNTLQKPQYGVSDGQYGNKRFWSSELHRVGGEAENATGLNVDKLNGMLSAGCPHKGVRTHTRTYVRTADRPKIQAIGLDPGPHLAELHGTTHRDIFHRHLTSRHISIA